MDKVSELYYMFREITKNDVAQDKLWQVAIGYIYQQMCDKNMIEKNDGLYNISSSLLYRLPEYVVDRLNYIFETTSVDIVKDFSYKLLFDHAYGNHDVYTSEELSNLVYDLLKIDGAGHIIFDMGSGTGNFISSICRKAKKQDICFKDIFGIEINNELADFSRMALSIICNEYRPIILNNNILEMETMGFPYNKAFVCAPIAYFSQSQYRFNKSRLFGDYKFKNSSSSEWRYIDILLNGLLDNGRAVAVVSPKALYNDSDLEYRNRLIQSGKLEGIIALPAGAVENVAKKLFILIFSNGNKQVKFVDASEMPPVTKNGKNTLPITDILDMYNAKDARTKICEELINANSLIPSVAILPNEKGANEMELKELATILTGNQYTLGVFEKKGLISTQKTGTRILSSSDIENGIVDWDNLTSINIEDKLDRAIIQKGDLIVSSKSSKVKTVYVDKEPSEKIIVTGGMLIIRTNKNVLNPIFLKMFLDSEEGANALKKIQKGDNIVSISASAMAQLLVPIVDIETQDKKAKEYNELFCKLVSLKEEAKKIENNLKVIYKQ